MNNEKSQVPQGKPARADVRAGFWMRALCLVLDIIILNFFFQALTFLFREQLFQIGEYTGYVGGGIAFLYFWLLNGPVGKGRTLAKFLFNMRVQDYQGEPLSYLDSFKRTVVIMIVVLFISLMFFDPFFHKTGAGEALFHGGLLSVCLSFVISNALLLGLHPFKQGFQDCFARSLVIRGETSITYEDLQKKVTVVLLNKKVRSPASAFQSAGIAFIVILSIQAWGAYQQFKSESWKSHVNLLEELREEFSVKGFMLSEYHFLPIRQDREKQQKAQGESEEGDQSPSVSDVNNEDRLTTPVGTTPYGFLVVYLTNNDASKSQIESDPEIQSMLPYLKEWVKNMLIRDRTEQIEQGHIPRELKVYFVERFSLFLHSHGKMEAEFTLPMDTEPFLDIYTKAEKMPPEPKELD